MRHIPVWRTPNGDAYQGDSLTVLKDLPDDEFQCIIADPPYFQVLEHTSWDTAWPDQDSWLEWSLNWIRECHRVVRPDGIIYIFGQLGKREHAWLHLCSEAARVGQFHDMVIWDRVVGYNNRGDSFTPQYEMALALRKQGSEKAYFNKDAVRTPYSEETVKAYLRDKRYKDRDAREAHLRRGKKATNILRVPSLKGSSREKVGHPSQKPERLIEILIQSSSRPGDRVLDPFLGSGTTAAVAERNGRKWVGIEVDATYLSIARTRLSSATRGNVSPAS
jgi:DNA modification methylase